jgi:large subunit ribosomal protein L4
MKLISLLTTGKKSTVTASDALFAAPVNKTLLSQAIRVYLSNLRQGTSKVKNRGEVNLRKGKVYSQKGTGNARHAAKSAPIFVGGGVAHGPKGVENWNLSLPQKLKHKAIISALSLQNEKVIVAEGVMDLDGKTKSAATLLATIAPVSQKILVILSKRTPVLDRSMRNLPNVLVRTADRVNALEISSSDWIVMTKSSINDMEKRLKIVEESKEV